MRIKSLFLFAAFIPSLYFIMMMSYKFSAPYSFSGGMGGFAAASAFVSAVFLGPSLLLCITAVVLAYSPQTSGVIGRIFSLAAWAICVFFYVYYCTEFQFFSLEMRRRMYSHSTIGNAILLAMTIFFFVNATLRTGQRVFPQILASAVSHVVGFFIVLKWLT